MSRETQWQRRMLQSDARYDYRLGVLGEEVYTDKATLVECPCCTLPGFEIEYGYVHAVNQDFRITECCVRVAPGAPEYRVFDDSGEEVYAGKFEIPGNELN